MSGPGPVVVMGVSGSGKTTLGRALAEGLAAPFQEGDDLHPPGNVARMAAGVPLTDADRAPWLDRVAAWLGGGEGWRVATCSALKRSYRDRLRVEAPGLRFVWVDVPRGELARRITHRTGHYMPVTLLDSQIATLEPPAADERALRLDGFAAPEASLAAALDWLRG